MGKTRLSNALYRFAGSILGYIISPFSLAGLGLPYYLRLDQAMWTTFGYVFLGLAGAAVLCNLYLRFHKLITGVGKVSYFRLVVSLSGIPALFLLWDERGKMIYVAAAGIVLFDFVGQAFIPKMFFGPKGEPEDQP